MCENITKSTLQCKSKELKGMYKCNVLLQTPYAVLLFMIIKKNVYKAPAPFPLAVYLYKSVTNIPLLVNLQLHRKGRRRKKKKRDTIKTTSWSLGIQCWTVSSRTRGRSARHVPGPLQVSDEANAWPVGCRTGLHCTPGSTGWHPNGHFTWPVMMGNNVSTMYWHTQKLLIALGSVSSPLWQHLTKHCILKIYMYWPETQPIS